MARLASSLLAGATVLLAGAAPRAEAAPRGRVIRVERGVAARVPRLCAMTAVRGQSICFGRPREGERIAVIDLADKAVRGEFVIESVSEAADATHLGVCLDTGLQIVKGSYVGGAEPGGHAFGLRGAKLSRRTARVISDLPSPSGRTEETVELAIDADGNGRADIVLTQYSCDASGAPSSGGMIRCLDTYMEQRGGLRRVQQDILRACP